MDDQISAVHTKFAELDITEILKPGDTTNLADIQPEVDKIYEWENDFYLNKEYRDQLPEPARKSIAQEFENASNLFGQIVKMRQQDIGGFATRKDDFISTVRNYYSSLYSAFVRDYRGWKLERGQEDKIKELDAIFAEAQKRQQSIRVQQEEVAQRADATAKLAQDLGLSKLAMYFYQLVAGDNEWIDGWKKNWWNNFWRPIIKFFRGYEGAARVWLLLAIVSFLLAFYVADSQLLPYIDNLTSTKNKQAAANTSATVIYAVLVAKALVLLVPLYAIRFCLKNYGSNKHLAADARHKAKTLQTLPTYLAIPRNDEAAIREIATTVARLVFTPTTSGFIVQKGDYEGSDITINAPQIKPSSS